MSSGELAFAAIYQAEWEWRQAHLGLQSSDPASPIDDFLPDVSEATQAERLAYWRATLEELDSLAGQRLCGASRTDLAVYREQLQTWINQQVFRSYQRPLNADTAFWTQISARAQRSLRSEEEAERYLDQLRAIPGHFEQQMINMRAGVRRGFAPPQIAMQGRDATLTAVAGASAEQTPYFAPFTRLPPSLPPAKINFYQAAARQMITEDVIPAYRKLATFFAQEYYPALPTDIAATSLPDGQAYYAAMLHEFTTTELTPQEIFDIGMTEVASIEVEMRAIATDLGYSEVEPLLEFMRTDPQFYATSAEGLLREAAWQAKKFDARVHQYFGRVPRMRFGIHEPAPDIAPFFTFGRGGPGRYVVNTYNLPARPLYSLPALTLHEAAPGHAFQIPLALELTHHPEFRRTNYISAYGEGWALYTERLGDEMGMYETPYELMGMLSFQMWRAARLVVDPGMHAFGWSRQRAIDFLRQHTAISDHEIVTEIDRYIAWPGQAAAYYLGQLKIIELRQRAERVLGSDFDLRYFHDAVLATGSVPLSILETEIERFIANGGASPFAPE